MGPAELFFNQNPQAFLFTTLTVKTPYKDRLVPGTYLLVYSHLIHMQLGYFDIVEWPLANTDLPT